jgi:hypothetical protein
MNRTLMAAAVLTVVIALVHSVVGERRIFRRLRRATSPGIPPSGFQIGILWASWHLVTLLGLALAACLACQALPNGAVLLPFALRWAMTIGMAGGAVLVAAGTRFKHPAWLGLSVVAVLVVVAG